MAEGTWASWREKARGADIEPEDERLPRAQPREQGTAAATRNSPTSAQGTCLIRSYLRIRQPQNR
jgi:hypothetical protein